VELFGVVSAGLHLSVSQQPHRCRLRAASGEYGSGVVVRLAIPITMLLVLAGCTFWVGHPESRINATSGLIIAVTALYIVLISNVPFVGYATRVDTFVLVVRDALL
jgi:hypothetical protein